ncbi:hypothetical protein LI410_mgp061 (mitochondrion) [Apium graveolens]|uniref:hypothetical protein n=1 Tax=Apium graveolens TaxID=4045 RepID=UPI001D00CEA0|nr:hypothetical protein LI410_mgp104 [Apium graveolens]YP_010185165.1 hypothetical protein LI410_mgp061 [Apium graveolens]QVJ97880.1 hypothetical protein [Apium graveolens]QVJ97922.1 hypothetical protein [Apium graveolens]QVJ98104.1 hypothetical protein [Apium graveolens]
MTSRFQHRVDSGMEVSRDSGVDRIRIGGGQSAYGRNQYGGQRQNQQFQQQQPRQWQNRQQGQGRYSVYGGNPNMIPVAPCATCGGHHPGKPCYSAVEYNKN